MQHNGSRWIGVFGTALAVLGIAGASWVNTAAAASGSAVSPLALPIAGLLTCDDRAGSSDASAAYSAGFAAEPPPAGSSDQYSRWRPRRDRGWREPVYRDRYRDQSRRDGFSQIHAGFLDPDGPQEAGLVLGYRMGFNVDQNIAIGGQLDWRHQGDQITSVVSEAPGPGGTTITTQQDVARSSSDLIPILGMVQVNAGDMGVIPYLGAGAGYEILHLSSDDFQNGQQFRGTFGGFGWQIWTGVAVPLSSQAKLTAEAFLNRADVSRDSTDPTTGDNIRETVNMDGVGARFGLQWGF